MSEETVAVAARDSCRPLLAHSILPVLLLVLASCADSLATPDEADGPPTGGPVDAPAERRICDGSAGLRFAAVMPASWRLAPFGMEVLYELGAWFILVNGRCEYVVWSRQFELRAWAGVRQGVLDEAMEAELGEAFGFATWPEREGSHGPDGESGYDNIPMVLSDGEHRLSCRQPCDVSDPTSAAALKGITARLGGLYAKGKDLEGPIRVRVFEADMFDNPGIEPVTWPLAASPDGLLSRWSPPGVLEGPVRVVEDADELRRLRALRPLLSAAAPTPALAHHPDPEILVSYWFAFRDVTPFEDSDGQIPGLFENP